MSDGIDINIQGQEFISWALKDLPEGLQSAALYAVNKTAREVNKRARAGAAKRAGIVPSVLTNHRRLATKLSKKQPNPSAFVWMGGNPLPAIYFSITPSDSEFLARMKRTWGGGTHEGHYGIFARVGRSRLPIEEIKWAFDEYADAEMAAQEPAAAQMLLDNFNEALADGQ